MLVAVVAAVFLGGSPASADSGTFSNTSAISVADRACPAGSPPGVANAYPSTINVSGLAGTTSKVTVTLKNASAHFAGDFDVLLVSPTGQNLKVVSDVGGGDPPFTNNVTVTFDDAAASTLSTSSTTPWAADNATVTAKPLDFNEPGFPDVFPSPAPAPSAATDLSTFNGANPNGTWSLYVVDDACGGGTDSIAGGWSLNVTTLSAAASSTLLTSSQNPALTGQPVTFTAAVTSGGSPVTGGTVTFKEGATTLSGPTAVDGAGRATFSTSSLTEGVHVVTAQYNGTVDFGPSSANVTETLDNPTNVSGSTYCNAGSITGGNPGAGTPYPSRAFVTGQSGLTSKVTVTLKNVTHAFPGDFDILLVGPGGQNLKVVSDAGTPSGTVATNNVTATFDDAAASLLPQHAPWGSANSSVTAKPTDYDEGAGFPDVFPAPAPGTASSPAPTGGATLGVFNGLSPNGTWSLYVVDDSLGDIGTIAGGWCLNFTTAPGSVTSTVVTSGTNPSLIGQAVNFTATVTSSGSPVTSGTVTFKEGATVLSGPTTLNSSGQAGFSTSTLPEGPHVVTAEYSGAAGLGPSSGTVTQTVDRATTQTGTTYCNTGPITINSVGPATPYPSHISVTGFPVTTSKVTVTLKGVSHPYPGDVDVLLVAPTGQNLTLVSDAGTASTTNVTATFEDSAAGSLAATGAWGAANASVTSKPVNYEGSVDSFPSPAPSPSAATTLATFNGIAPAGTWSLYVVDDSVGDGGSIANGWCINLTPVKASPTLTTTASPTVAVGGQVHDTATVAGGGSPTGMITFKLFGPNDATCANAAVSTTTATVNGNGSYDSPNFTTAALGTYRWTAVYGGDTFNNSASSSCNAANESVVAKTPSTVADFNGDGRTDIAVFRPSVDEWYLQGQGDTAFGASGDIPVPADYNGDGKTEIAVYRPATGAWMIQGQPDIVWGGVPGDIPVPADYNGDGKADIAIYRPTQGAWYVRGQAGAVWGVNGDIPVPADYNGDGKADIAVYRPGAPGAWYIQGQTGAIWGTTGDIPVPADYNGDGKADVAVFRPTQGAWYIQGQTGAIWGTTGDIPVPGDYANDGRADIAVFRPSDGGWYVMGQPGSIWGAPTDVPLPLPSGIRMFFF